MSAPLPPKKEVALALLERSSVHIHLDPRASGVVVPAWFKKQPQLVLQVGLNMPVPIPDLRLDDDGLSCTLSFNRTPFFCVVPWLSIYALVGDDGRGMVWPDHVPPEVASQASKTEGDGAKRAGPRRVPTPVPNAASADAGQTSAGSQRAARESAGETSDTGENVTAKAKKPKKRTRTDTPRDGETVSPARANLVAVPGSAKKGPQAVPDKSLRASTPESASASPPNTPDRVDPPSPPTVIGVGRPKTTARPKRELPPYLRVVK